MDVAASPSKSVILASTSPRRRELMASLQIPFEVMPSDADEEVPSNWTPEQIVTVLAMRKAQTVYNAIAAQGAGADRVIIGSDTVVVLEDQVLGKPQNEEEAASMLRCLQGRSHCVLTAIACIDVLTGRSEVDYRSTTVHMKPLTEEKIIAYAATGEGLDKAGAYAIQGLASIFVIGIEGCYFNVVGLPLSLLSEMLERFGVKVL